MIIIFYLILASKATLASHAIKIYKIFEDFTIFLSYIVILPNLMPFYMTLIILIPQLKHM